MISFNNFYHKISVIHNKKLSWLTHTFNLNKIKEINLQPDPIKFYHIMEGGERNDNRKQFDNEDAGNTDDNIVNINIDPREFEYKENNPLHNVTS